MLRSSIFSGRSCKSRAIMAKPDNTDPSWITSKYRSMSTRGLYYLGNSSWLIPDAICYLCLMPSGHKQTCPMIHSLCFTECFSLPYHTTVADRICQYSYNLFIKKDHHYIYNVFAFMWNKKFYLDVEVKYVFIS